MGNYLVQHRIINRQYRQESFKKMEVTMKKAKLKIADVKNEVETKTATESEEINTISTLPLEMIMDITMRNCSDMSSLVVHIWNSPYFKNADKIELNNAWTATMTAINQAMQNSEYDD